jgi:beta-phosphoglucomutase-like phosphatase (HAD superfamily)
MIQAVIFDLDGVIIDSEPIHFKLEQQMFDELKIAISFKEHCSFVGMSLSKYVGNDR